MNKIPLRALSSPSGMQYRGKRCRLRGRNYVRPEVKQSNNFSKDEDDLILKLHALLGNRWALIAGRLPGRTDNEVRIHWETYLKRKLIKMGIDPTNHRLHHHTSYISRRYLKSSHKEHETKIISDQSSSVSESCGITFFPISSTSCSEDSISTGQSRLPDLNIGLILTPTSLPGRCLQDSSQFSNYGSTGQETLLLFQ
ncbi:PREDICTED: myb-related protein 308-like [Camelina sativa]|uniref:Myb-related protein 308-like n=1 Tax=Camelina sativa TaxID=90675 RepID=A0ABM0WHD3_CAMSA|nr:PREDICTED: myb-related protein 308-like [Camelina sativa]